MGRTLRLGSTTSAAIAAAAALTTVLVLVLAPPAAGQDDPYGGTTTTTEGTSGVEARCDLSVDQGDPGATVVASALDVQAGSVVTVLFGGVEVASATAEGAGSGVVDVQIPFTVPDIGGEHAVTLVGASFTADCTAGVGFLVTGSEVLGEVVTPGGSGSSGGGIGSLARTGAGIALLLAVALVLLLVGRVLLAGSRRRSRRLDRSEAGARVHLGTTQP